MSTLKEEINTSVNSIYSLSQWRLVLISLLIAVGLGLWREANSFKDGYLLLFIVPFVSAYVDMLIYERSSVIHSIARFLRKQGHSTREMAMLSNYENYVNERRLSKGAGTSFERRGNFSVSLLTGILSPGLALLNSNYRPTLLGAGFWLWLIPLFGIALVVLCAHQHKMVIEELTNDLKKSPGDEWCNRSLSDHASTSPASPVLT